MEPQSRRGIRLYPRPLTGISWTPKVKGGTALAPTLAPGRASLRDNRRPAGRNGPLTAPVTYYKLPNGLRVVLSRDTTAPPSSSPSTTTSDSASSPRTAPASRTSSST